MAPGAIMSTTIPAASLPDKPADLALMRTPHQVDAQDTSPAGPRRRKLAEMTARARALGRRKGKSTMPARPPGNLCPSVLEVAMSTIQQTAHSAAWTLDRRPVRAIAVGGAVLAVSLLWLGAHALGVT